MDFRIYFSMITRYRSVFKLDVYDFYILLIRVRDMAENTRIPYDMTSCNQVQGQNS